MNSNNIDDFGFLHLDGRRRLPIYRQIYEQLRSAILVGTLKVDDRIPSSRDLVKQLGVSRTTVVTAIEMLISEGYLATRHGQGTFVSSEIPDRQLVPLSGQDHGREKTATTANGRIPLSQLGRDLLAAKIKSKDSGRPAPLCPGEPALDLFPGKIWARISRRVWNSVSPVEISYGECSGYFPLRNQIAEYLRVHRGVVCDTSQVMIVNGTQQAVDMVARLTLDKGDRVLFEDPGYISARESFVRHGAQVVSLPVDERGASVEAIHKGRRKPKLVYVTPSHQFPLGVTMTIERRLELIEWAQKNQALIFEDDYDSEFRYGQRPLPCLQGLDRSSRTIYVGSFSKVVCPGLGIGYAIVPAEMVAAVENFLSLVSRPPSRVDQIVLSEFIREGHFVRHIRRMRKEHGKRRQALVDALRKQIPDKLQVIGNSAGLHCTTMFQGVGMRDTNVVLRLAEKRVVARALSNYYGAKTSSERRKQGLVLGFASSTIPQIGRAVSTLRTILA